MFDLILVSQSPRRREILENAGFVFRVDTLKVSEILEENLNIEAAISKLAMDKSSAYLNSHKHLKLQDILLLSADTMVVLGDQALGKPKNEEEAHEFLRDLSGKMHRVITGVFVSNLKTGESFEFVDTTKVWFREITDSEISDYIQTGEPMDKAGAYAIQGKGRKFVARTEGSYNNVVGLPLEKLEVELAKRNWVVKKR